LGTQPAEATHKNKKSHKYQMISFQMQSKKTDCLIQEDGVEFTWKVEPEK